MARWMVVVWMVIITVVAASCADNSLSAPRASNSQTSFPMTITDDAQRTVTIDKAPQRIVSLASSNTELVYAVGLQDKLVGVDEYSDYPPEAKNKEKVGGFSNTNLEKVIGLAPDLVLATNIHVKTLVPQLESHGTSVVVFQPPRLENIADNLNLLGRAGGNVDAGKRAADDLLRSIDSITARTKSLTSRPRVLFELSPDLITVGPDTFIDDMISKAGGQNIARDATMPWPKLSLESIVLKDPEVIILADHGTSSGGVTEEMTRARPGWSAISAVKTGRIIPLADQNITNRPGPRAVQGLEFFARAIHPEVFE